MGLIITAVLALALGIWLGLPGRYDQDMDELEKSLGQKTRRRKRKKREISPLAWVQRSGKAASARRSRPGFSLENPEDD